MAVTAATAVNAAELWRRYQPTAKLPDNGFRIEERGQKPPDAAGGWKTQTGQAARMVLFAGLAAESVLTKGAAPGDVQVRHILDSLEYSVPTGDERDFSYADYYSHIPGVTPQQVYDFYVNDPEIVLSAATIKLRPVPEHLSDGVRVMLEDRRLPPVWAPCAIDVDDDKEEIHISTLEGHPLRGTNTFTFEDDGKGGTNVVQRSVFQCSSLPSELGMKVVDAVSRQHAIWQNVHAKLYWNFHPEA